MEKIVNKFKKNPTVYYAFSICATWAGIGSLMNGITMTQNYGAIPSLIWTIGNVLACIIFGLIATKIPKVRNVFCHPIMMFICSAMCVFQAWLSMNGMQTIWQGTSIPNGKVLGIVIAYVLAISFLLILIKFGMIRNVLTDHVGWIIVYGLVILTVVCSLIYSNGSFNAISMGTDAENLKVGFEKAYLLLAGPFTYPYFFAILNYNDDNNDDTQKINTTKAFVYGGLLFGLYMALAFVLAWTKFSPALNIVKAVLITIIGTSTLSSSMYSIYISFGKKFGFVVNALLIAGWAFLIPLGVMNLWTLMASIRIYFVGAGILVGIVWSIIARAKENKLESRL